MCSDRVLGGLTLFTVLITCSYVILQSFGMVFRYTVLARALAAPASFSEIQHLANIRLCTCNTMATGATG